MLKIVLYSTSYSFIGNQIHQFSYFEMIEPHARLSWSGKYLSYPVYTKLHYTFRIRPSNNLIIYNGEQKKLDISLAMPKSKIDWLMVQ